MNKGKHNIYRCLRCSAELVTIDRDEGTTPMLVECTESNCTGLMQSQFYPNHAKDRTPTHEWYRRKIRRSMSPYQKDHIKMGGLDLRPL